jgi:hypothetical protein
MILALIILIVLILFISKAWRYFLESSDDIRHIRVLEPWYWFIFLNLSLTLISSNYDYQFVWIGLLIQIALAVWFAVSIGWIVQSCEHKNAILNQSSFFKGRKVKFCYRCGTRLPDESNAALIEDHSWQTILLQLPPRLLEYVSFWVAQSMMVLITLFLALKMLKHEEFQNQAVLIAIILVILLPPLIYFLGRFKRYLSDTKGMIWWDDFKSSFAAWGIVIGLIWCLLHFFAH